MVYKIVIRRNSDGVKHVCRGFDGDWSEYWWLEGNGACDCNRKRTFEEVMDPDLPEDETSCPCGSGAYSVLEARLPDGTVIELED